MAENLIINGENKRELYETLLHQLQSLTAGETDVVANMANVAAALKSFRRIKADFQFLLGRLLCGKRRDARACPVPGASCLHAHPVRERCMRNSLEGCTNNRCPGRRAISGTYRL